MKERPFHTAGHLWDMEGDDVEFYSQERWDNWIDRVEDADLDDEDEGPHLFLNLQNDAAIAVAKVIQAFERDHLSATQAQEELEHVRDIVLVEPAIDEEEAAMLIDAVQTSLVCVFMAADRYFHDEPIDIEGPRTRIDAAVAAEEDEEFNEALAHVAELGAYIIDGNEIDMSIMEDVEYGLVTEWLGGLDSLQEALAGPKVVEEED